MRLAMVGLGRRLPRLTFISMEQPPSTARVRTRSAHAVHTMNHISPQVRVDLSAGQSTMTLLDTQHASSSWLVAAHVVAAGGAFARGRVARHVRFVLQSTDVLASGSIGVSKCHGIATDMATNYGGDKEELHELLADQAFCQLARDSMEAFLCWVSGPGRLGGSEWRRTRVFATHRDGHDGAEGPQDVRTETRGRF